MEAKTPTSWHSQNVKDVLQSFSSSKKGLSTKEAQKRLEENGPNELPKKPPRSIFLIFLAQIASPFMIILIFAAAVSAFLGELFDVVVIGLALGVNIILGFVEEYKADRSLHALQKYLPQNVNVRRDGKIRSILSKEVVEGDILLLVAGDKVTADGRIVDSQACEMDESALTGESGEVKKTKNKVKSGVAVADRSSMVFAGTIMVGGHAEVLVTNVGVNTQIGKISKMVSELEEEKTPLQKQLRRFAGILGVAVFFMASLIFIVGSLSGFDVSEMFYLSVAISVAAVPEGLAVALTVILAIGMQRILKKKALVRRLIAAETLGSVSVICMDKTGTLTTGKMEVDEIRCGSDIVPIDGDDKRLQGIARAILRTSSARVDIDKDTGKEVVQGSLTEVAMYRFADKFKSKLNLKKEKKISELPFNSKIKFAASSFESGKGHVVYAVGAPDILLKRADVSDKQMKSLLKTFDSMTAGGLRVLMACRGTHLLKHEVLKESLVKDLKVLGFIGLRDPLRKEANETIALAKSAGIVPVMITGDHPETARMIAIEAGLDVREGDMLTGAELDDLSDDELFSRVDGIKVYARVSPSHKLRIIRAWQKLGKSVAMTGDGVNDAPALKAADIGIALGSGTAVAKETADMVLLDNNVRVIVDAIKEGRTIFDNLRKMIVYFLVDSFSEIVLVLGALLMSLPLPILPAQILWINLIADGLPSIALTFEKAEDGIMNEPPRPKDEPILNGEMKALIFFVGLLTNVLLFGIFFYLLKHDVAIEEIRTFIFLALGIDSLIYIFAVRKFRTSVFSSSPFENKILLGSVVIGFVMMFIPFSIPALRELFKLTQLSTLEWGILLGLSMVQLVVIEIVKEIYNLRRKKKQQAVV